MRIGAFALYCAAFLGVALLTTIAAWAQQAPPSPEAEPAATETAQPSQPRITVAKPEGDADSTRAADELEAQQEQQEEKKSNWLLQIFGPGMWPLWICSIALVALMLERRRALRTERIMDPAMVEKVVDLVGDLNVDEAQKVSGRSDTVLGRAWAQGLHEFTLGGAALAETLTNSTVLAFKPLKRNLGALATLGVISPLFGLLGTVLGMIITFHQIAATGGADKSKLAGGIGLALFTTAGGLIVAIPAILSNRYFTGKLNGIAEQAEEAISRINYRYSHATAEAQKKPADGNAPGLAGEGTR